MASGTRDTRTGGAGQVPPSPDEIAARFPQFEVVECLGRGGMGVVYKARQKSLDRWVAIKVLAPERIHDERFAEHFEKEAKTLARMSHPNIVTVFDHGESDGLFYIVMEYVDGVNLRDLLREGKMAPEQALAIVPPVCEALEYAHGKGVVHRDIKPENLLLDRDGRVKIADFGIASLVGATGEKSGTPPYMAPEQEQGTVDRRADIYALGVVLYEMLTGERPAKDVVAPSRKVEVDVKIDEMVLRALEKEPERRYQTAAEFRTMAQTMAGSGKLPATSSGIREARFNAGSVRLHFTILAVTWWISMPLGAILPLVSGEEEILLLLLWLPAMAVAGVFWCVLLYRQWLLLQGHGARVTPGKAVGYGFIPFYCFYWWFHAYAGLATDTNRCLERAGAAAPRMSFGLSVTYCVLGVLLCTIGLHPVAGALIDVPYMIVGFILILQQRDCVLALLKLRSGEAADLR
ncbi:serine/threonine-protein kinase [Luteolibacter marinus]|uniref:serine/threonine-protein kinase n=1 Tax=Luteolibacter marinus TaxID=2776705 RepID=UPI001866A622|nr:serine/threonine-protein kinase [Luteolibacter marinus]